MEFSMESSMECSMESSMESSIESLIEPLIEFSASAASRLDFTCCSTTAALALEWFPEFFFRSSWFALLLLQLSRLLLSSISLSSDFLDDGVVSFDGLINDNRRDELSNRSFRTNGGV